MLASDSVSSGIPVYLYLQCIPIIQMMSSRLPLEDHWAMASASVVPVYCPVATKCTESVWFGGHYVGSLPSMQTFMYTTGMAGID